LLVRGSLEGFLRGNVLNESMSYQPAFKVKKIKQFLAATEGTKYFNRDAIYRRLIEECGKCKDHVTASEAWNLMQEENLIPSEKTLAELRKVLESCNVEVPFN